MTSIDWLFEKLWEEPKDKLTWYSIFNQAIDMHKKEHGDTWDAALLQGSKRAGNFMRAYEDFDDYYQETFKKSNNEGNITKK